MTLDLTEHEAALLLKELNGLIDGLPLFPFRPHQDPEGHPR